MKRTSNKFLWMTGIIFILVASIVVFRIVDYTQNATIYQGELTSDSDSVMVIIDGQRQTTAIVETYENEEDSTESFLVTELGVVKVKNNLN